MLLFVVAFEFSAGPLLWLYMPEVLNGAGVSAGTVVNWVFVIIISISTPQLANHIGEWMFYIFAIFNVIVRHISFYKMKLLGGNILRNVFD